MTAALIERLEASDRGSYELDAEVHRFAMAHGVEYKGGPLPLYTDSLDAALALAERVLPGHAMNVCKDTGPPDGPAFRWSSVVAQGSLAGPVGRPGWWFGVSDTPALALCIAILKAKAAQS